jgi:CheY-like chemotaxis protein
MSSSYVAVSSELESAAQTNRPLPAALEQDAPMLPPLRSSGVREVSNSCRVLIVDDNADSADLLAFVLARAGYELRVAGTPAAALALADEFCPQIALIDIGLPDMDGYELLGVLRRKPQLDQCRFIAVTGYGNDQFCGKAQTRASKCT